MIYFGKGTLFNISALCGFEWLLVWCTDTANKKYLHNFSNCDIVNNELFYWKKLFIFEQSLQNNQQDMKR